MGKKKSKSNLKSNCCNADIKVGGSPDFIGGTEICTCYYICTKCEDACDVHLNQRRTWNINPVTKIKGDERGKKKKLFTDKEVKEFLRGEDF